MKTGQTTLHTTADISSIVSRIQNTLNVFFSSVASSFGTAAEGSNSSAKMSARKFKRFIKGSPALPFIIVGIILLLLIVISLARIFSKPSSTSAVTNTGRVELRKPLASQSLTKSFLFPLKDSTGKQLSDLKFFIQNAEIRDQIIIQGKIANATVGKNILIVNIELTNNYTKGIEIKTRNYVRLLKNNDKKLYDPKIHNDPVDVQPISTTLTRLGFTLNDTDKNLILRIGDVTDSTSKTQDIKLTLSK